jgi:hypothetical protein
MSTFGPKYTLFNSIQEMLAPETLSGLLNQRITRVTCQPFESSNGWSKNQLVHVKAGKQKLVMKRLRLSMDWLAAISKDTHCRSVRVWQYGLLDRLQPYMQHGILAACREDEDYAILMQDLSPGLLNGRQLSSQTVFHMLDALSRMHAIYWEDETLRDDALGLSNIDTKLSYIRPLHPGYFEHAPQILDIMQKGRSDLLDMVEPDVCAILQSLYNSSLPIEAFLHCLPKTLVHTDYRLDNLAFFRDTQELVVFDWQQASFAPMIDDVCWFVGSLAEHISAHETYYEYYRQQLTTYLGDRFDPSLWRAMLDVGCLLEVMTKGTWHAFFAVTNENEAFRADMRRSVATYNDLVRKAVVWL